MKVLEKIINGELPKFEFLILSLGPRACTVGWLSSGICLEWIRVFSLYLVWGLGDLFL